MFTRPGKTDFTSLYTQHKKQMDANGCKVDDMIKVRRKIHSYPEGAFQEFETHKTIKETLKGFGVKAGSFSPAINEFEMRLFKFYVYSKFFSYSSRLLF